MKWIQAQVRQPEDWNKVYVKLSACKTPIAKIIDVFQTQIHCLYFGGFEEGTNQPLFLDDLCYFEEVQWLDKTPQQVEIGVDHFPHRPYFKIGNQTFFIDADEPENYEWYCEQMKKAFESVGLEVKHEVI